MALNNPEMMNGTGGTPDFLVVGMLQTPSNKFKIGIRPLFAAGGAYSSGDFRIEVAFRVRFQEVSGAAVNANGFETLVKQHLPTGSKNFKVLSDYASFVVATHFHGKIDATAQNTITKAKDGVLMKLTGIEATLALINSVSKYPSKEVHKWFIDKFQKELASCGIDCGDYNQPVPAKQPMVEKMQQQAAQAGKTGTTSGTTGKQSTGATQNVPKGTGKPTKPLQKDKYEQKQLTEEDLAGMSFEQLMGTISQKKED